MIPLTLGPNLLSQGAVHITQRSGSYNAKAVSRCAKAVSRFFAAQSQRPSGGGHRLSLRKKRKLGRKKREQGSKKREFGRKERGLGRRKWGQQAWGRLLVLNLSKHRAELSRYSLANATSLSPIGPRLGILLVEGWWRHAWAYSFVIEYGWSDGRRPRVRLGFSLISKSRVQPRSSISCVI